jgi:hypothetical protein
MKSMHNYFKNNDTKMDNAQKLGAVVLAIGLLGGRWYHMHNRKREKDLEKENLIEKVQDHV